MSRNKGSNLFLAIVFLLLGLSIGFDYFKVSLLKSNPHYTIGYVTEYKSYVRTLNNRIHYYYVVNGKQFTAKYRSSELNPALKGHRILIRFSPRIKSINEPLFKQLILDDIQPPDGGWTDLPRLHVVDL